MKTWDMLEILAKYPEKKFNNKLLGQVELHEGILVWSSNMEDVAISNTLLKMEWEEVKEPVNFMAAVESGKKISVKCAIETYEGKGKLREIYYKELSEMLRILAGYGDEIATDIILNGKWYIE